jgi:glycosyltransferase involved in cell wall biosynthesis
MIPATIVIATKNEENNISDAILSAHGFSEILIVDSNSTDRTVIIAKSLGARVVNFNWNGKLPKKREWILRNIVFKTEWIFFLDADERFTKELYKEISDFFETAKGEYSAGQVKMKFVFMGKALRFGHRIRSIKLLRVGSCNYPQIEDSTFPGMGEMEGHFQASINGKLKKFQNPLLEADNDNIADWFQRHVRYAEWDAAIMNDRSIRFQVLKHKTSGSRIFYSVPFRPITFFVYSYILKAGFLDGRRGFNFALSYSWFFWLCELIKKENR